MKEKIEWTKEKCHEEALKYETRTEFKRFSSTAYEISRVNLWLNEICTHISKNRRWNLELSQKEALKYKTRSQFSKNNPNAYSAARNHRWLNDICSHMDCNYWTKDECQTIALKYETRKEFIENDKNVYGAAVRNKWIKDICSHMKRYGNKLNRCIYVYEFSDNSAYVGLSYNLEKRNISRKNQSYDAVTKHIDETGLTPKIKQLSQYICVDIAATLEIECIKMYETLGWNVLNKSKGGEIGSVNKYWTKELCHEEALKYKTRNEFYLKKNNIYAAAQRYGWLDDICKHMYFKHHHWTVDEIKIEALKYRSRGEFGIKNKAAYTWAIRHNILNEVCSHMQSMIGNNQHDSRNRIS